MTAHYQEKKDLLYYQAYLVQDSGRVSRSQTSRIRVTQKKCTGKGPKVRGKNVLQWSRGRRQEHT